jgi:hypothetical protein
MNIVTKQRGWKALQLMVFFTFAGDTYMDPSTSLPFLIFVQVPTLMLVCGALAFIATSLLSKVIDAASPRVALLWVARTGLPAARFLS